MTPVPLAEAAGLRMRYREWGAQRKDAGTPIVLLHGAGSSSVTWMDLGRRLGTQRHSIAPDLPGHGQSAPLPHATSISIDGYRDLVGWLCATVGLARALLVGHSMGGAIALSAALAWPEKVAGLAMVASGARLPVSERTLVAIRDHFPTLPDLMALTCYSPETPRAVAERWARVTMQAPRETVLADFEACARFDLRARLPELRVPMLGIAAADDLMVPAKVVRELGGRVIEYERAGHNLQHEHPEALARDLLGFAAQLD
ncbi:MAG TPA: alpha/beta hydrolase [Polyangia bacterium]|nr:alpha/beta hydrolase [Polyangia bacterium]